MPTFAAAQDIDCGSAMTTVEMTYCADQAYQAADGDLNLAYGLAVAQAERLDATGFSGPVSVKTLLRDAQRAWIGFRDAACDVEAAVALGGTMSSQLYLGCLERLTRQRTEDLRSFGEMN